MKYSYLTSLLCLSLALFQCQGQSWRPPVKEVIEGKVAFNRKVQWKFSPCGEIEVNRKKLRLGAPLKEWVDRLGPYDRFNRLMMDVYTWDKYGLMAASDWRKDTIIQMQIVFHFQHSGAQDTSSYDPVGDRIQIEGIWEEIAARPNPVFEGGVLLDNVVLGRGMSIKDFNQLSESHNRTFKFNKDIFPHRYSFYPNDCPSAITYIVNLSEDFKDIEQIIVDNLPNGIWETEQELKQEQAEQEKADSTGSPFKK